MTKSVKSREGDIRPAELRGVLTTGMDGAGPVLTSAFPDHVAYALMFRQLAQTARAIQDMHKATDDLRKPDEHQPETEDINFPALELSGEEANHSCL